MHGDFLQHWQRRLGKSQEDKKKTVQKILSEILFVVAMQWQLELLCSCVPDTVKNSKKKGKIFSIILIENVQV